MYNIEEDNSNLIYSFEAAYSMQRSLTLSKKPLKTTLMTTLSQNVSNIIVCMRAHVCIP